MIKNIFINIKSKLAGKRGESLSETLVAVLVMCMAMAVISGSIVTAARINRKAEDMETSTMLKAGDERTSNKTGTMQATEKRTANVRVTKGTGLGTEITDISVDLYTDPANGADFKFYELPDNP